MTHVGHVCFRPPRKALPSAIAVARNRQRRSTKAARCALTIVAVLISLVAGVLALRYVANSAVKRNDEKAIIATQLEMRPAGVRDAPRPVGLVLASSCALLNKATRQETKPIYELQVPFSFQPLELDIDTSVPRRERRQVRLQHDLQSDVGAEFAPVSQTCDTMPRSRQLAKSSLMYSTPK